MGYFLLCATYIHIPHQDFCTQNLKDKSFLHKAFSLGSFSHGNHLDKCSYKIIHNNKDKN